MYTKMRQQGVEVAKAYGLSKTASLIDDQCFHDIFVVAIEESSLGYVVNILIGVHDARWIREFLEFVSIESIELEKYHVELLSSHLAMSKNTAEITELLLNSYGLFSEAILDLFCDVMAEYGKSDEIEDIIRYNLDHLSEYQIDKLQKALAI